MIAAGPYLLANGNLSALEELLRRAEEDPDVQTLVLVCRENFGEEIGGESIIFSWDHFLMNDHRMCKIYKRKRTNNFSMKSSRKSKGKVDFCDRMIFFIVKTLAFILKSFLFHQFVIFIMIQSIH